MKKNPNDKQTNQPVGGCFFLKQRNPMNPKVSFWHLSAEKL